jgi:hypothetical protein
MHVAMTVITAFAQFVNRCDREQKAALSTERRQHREKMRQKEMEELHKAHTRHATEDESVGRVRNEEELRLAVGVCQGLLIYLLVCFWLLAAIREPGLAGGTRRDRQAIT